MIRRCLKIKKITFITNCCAILPSPQFLDLDFNLIDIQYFFQIKNELRFSWNGKNGDKERMISAGK